MSGEGGGHLRPHRSPRVPHARRSGLLIALVGGALTSAAAIPRPATPLGIPAARTVFVHGHVRGLYPGATRPMQVSVRNPAPVSVRLVRMTARVSNASSACLSRNVSIRRFVGAKTIAPLGRIRISLRSRMRRRAPNACQGARFPVTFTATLTRT
jgi:hypothetical protein